MAQNCAQNVQTSFSAGAPPHMITIPQPQRHIRTDGHTTCLGNTALCVASRGKKIIRLLKLCVHLYRTSMMTSKKVGLQKFLVVVLMMLTTDGIITSLFGAKILFMPGNVNSHVLYFSRLAADLTQLGHVTRVLAPSNIRVPHFVAEAESGGNFSYTTYPVDGDEPFFNSRHFSEVLTRLALSQSTWEKFSGMSDLTKEIFNHLESDCISLLGNVQLMQQIRDGGFQFAVMEPIVPQCYYAIPYSMGIRYATLSLPLITWIYRVPRLPSFSSNLGIGYTDQMTLVQRLTTFVLETLLLFQVRNDTTTYVAQLAPDRPALGSIQLLQQVQRNHILWSFVINAYFAKLSLIGRSADWFRDCFFHIPL